MFCVVYEIDVIDGADQQFIECWTEITNAIRKYEGSLGSCLHQASDGRYVAYARWPDRETWQKADGSALPPKIRARQQACARYRMHVTVKYELDLIENLLENGAYHDT